MISEINADGAMPALEQMMRFAAQRQRILAANIANISTPDYIMKDVSVPEFQKSLRDAIDHRRAGEGGTVGGGKLDIADTREVRHVNGDMVLEPQPTHAGVLFHDRNNRDIERLMQGQVENALAFRLATELLTNRFNLMRSAIAERV